MKSTSRFFAAFLTVITICVQVNAQSITGKVIEENGTPIEFATIALCTLPDSTIATGTITDENGQFDIAGEGNFIRISMMGFQTRDLAVNTLGNDNTIVLHTDAKLLNEVVISASLPKTEVKGNAVVTNIAGSVLQHVGNANDVLAKVPGMISKSDGLEVIGRGKPEYYINGRKVTDDSELRDLMSEDIKSIDVISNPGAAYGGEVRCVVRIRTVKRQGEGFSYALTSQAKQHIYDCKDFEPSWTVLDMNYRIKGLDFIGKLVYWNQCGYQISDIDGGTITKSGNLIYKNFQKGNLDYRSKNGGLQAVAGINWQISQNHSLGFKLDFSDDLLYKNRLLMDVDVIENDVPVDHVNGVNDTKADGPSGNLNTNLYYDGNIGKLNVNFNADFVKSYGSTRTDVHETTMTAAPTSFMTSSNGDSYLGAGKLVLTYPVWKGLLQVGSEETYVSSNEEYKITFSGIPSADVSFSENTLAFFAEYGAALPFGQLSAGLRYEHSNFDYNDNFDASRNLNRPDDTWFPSFSFSTKAGSIGLNLSYSGKNIRPRYNSLSSEVTYDNKFTYQMGDPKLKNETHRTLSLNANWKWLTFSGNFESTQNSIYQKAYPYNDQGVVMIQWANCPDPVRKLSVFVNASPSIGLWYPRLTVGMEKQFFKTAIIDPRVTDGKREVSLGRPMYVVQANNTLKFNHGWTVDADYQFYSPFDELIMSVKKPIQQADIAVSKSFLANEALNIRLSCTDIFKSYIYSFHAEYGNIVIDQSNSNFRPCIQLRVSYRFNSANSKYKGTGAGQEAKDRM